MTARRRSLLFEFDLPVLLFVFLDAVPDQDQNLTVGRAGLIVCDKVQFIQQLFSITPPPLVKLLADEETAAEGKIRPSEKCGKTLRRRLTAQVENGKIQ